MRDALIVALAQHYVEAAALEALDRLIALLREGGSTGALLCIAVQFLQVVIAAIPLAKTGAANPPSSDARFCSSRVRVGFETREYS